jgi:hypothetical protein
MVEGLTVEELTAGELTAEELGLAAGAASCVVTWQAAVSRTTASTPVAPLTRQLADWPTSFI